MSEARSSRSTSARVLPSYASAEDLSDDDSTEQTESVLTENDTELLQAVTGYGNTALQLVQVLSRTLGANPDDWNNNNKSVKNIKPLVIEYYIDFIWRLHKEDAAGVLGCEVESVNESLKAEMRIRTKKETDRKDLLALKNKIKKNVNNFLEKHVLEPARQLFQVAKLISD